MRIEIFNICEKSIDHRTWRRSLCQPSIGTPRHRYRLYIHPTHHCGTFNCRYQYIPEKTIIDKLRGCHSRSKGRIRTRIRIRINLTSQLLLLKDEGGFFRSERVISAVVNSRGNNTISRECLPSRCKENITTTRRTYARQASTLQKNQQSLSQINRHPYIAFYPTT